MRITIAFITILALISMTGYAKGSATPTHSRSAISRSPGASSQKFAEKTKFHKAVVKVAIMSEIAKPVNILVDAEQIYIVSGAKIYIYSAKDYSFKKVFGKKGEGPGDEFNIRIYDKNGNFSHALEKDFPFVKITDNDKELLFNYYKFLVKDFMRLKPRLVIPKYYPAIFDFTEMDNKLYVLTWKVVDKKREILVVDLKGKMLLKSFIPHKGPLRGDGNSPYTFYNNKLYQLYDNPDTETWELLVHEVK